MASAQDWCLECGTAAASSRFGRRPGWGAAAGIITATVVLAAGAVAAGYAALNRSSKRVVSRPATLAQVPPAATPAPVTPNAATGNATVPPVPGTRATKVPKIPTRISTPPAAAAPPVTSSPSPVVSSPPAATSPTTHTRTRSTVSPKSAAAAPGSKVVLDADAAATYNPYGYPDSSFTDPSLAIDQDPTTSWTAQIDPSAAPRNADGITLDLKSPQTLHQLKLQTRTPGIEVEVYGANGAQPPPSITDPSWRHLTAPHTTGRVAKFKLLTGGQKFRFLVVWITKAPSSSAGSTVAISEVTLYH